MTASVDRLRRRDDLRRQDPFYPFADKLKDLVSKRIRQRIDTSRQMQLILALRAEMMWRAKQNLRLSAVDNGNGTTIMPLSTPPGGAPYKQGESQTLNYVFNIFRGDGQKFISVVGGRTPYATAEPKRSNDPESINQADQAKALIRYFDELWDADNDSKDVARTIWRSGPRFTHICWVTDADKYGTVDIPNVDIQQDGTPSITSQPTPRGMPEIHAYSIWEVAIPPKRKRLQDCEWLDCRLPQSSGKLRKLYGVLLEGIKDETASTDNTGAAQAAGEGFDLIAAAGNTRLDRVDEWWWDRTWLRPEMYEYCDDAQLKALLQEKAPGGIRLVWVNDHYVEAVPENHNDCWEVCKTGTDDLILGDPIGNDLVPGQQIINDFFNLAIETMLRAIPRTLVDPRLVNRQAIEQNPANVAELIWALPGYGKSYGDGIKPLPVAAFSDQMMPLFETIRGVTREIDGVQEAVFGGGEPAPTWRQDNQRKNQALAQFFISWTQIRLHRAGVIRKALALLKKYGIGQIEVPAENDVAGGSAFIDLATFDPDQVKIDTEESMPQTRVEEVDELREQLTYAPQLQAILGLFDPINAPRLKSLLSVRGMTSSMADLTIKCLRLIQKLLTEQAAPPTDPNTGQPTPGAPLSPSIAPDPFDFRNAQFAAEVLRSWVNSKEGQKAETSNQSGFDNVRAFGAALDKMASPPPPKPELKPSLGISISDKTLAPNQIIALLGDAGVDVPPADPPPIPMPVVAPGGPPLSLPPAGAAEPQPQPAQAA